MGRRKLHPAEKYAADIKSGKIIAQQEVMVRILNLLEEIKENTR